MKIHMQGGKVRFSTLLILLVVFYVGFCAVKIASAHIMKGQIKTTVVNRIGDVRGPDLSVEKCEEIILDVLDENGVLGSTEPQTDEGGKTDNTSVENAENSDNDPIIKVTIGKNKATIHFSITYQLTSNLVLFKYKSQYFVEGDIQNYN